jgi:RNA polymerase sigma-70 factor (ECF subfamily)
MPEPSFHTLHLRGWLDRLRAGDAAARDEILRACQTRLHLLVRKMLRRNPSVGRWTESSDVFTNASLRLLRALEKVDVADTRGFFNLASAVIRRELIDLARHFYGPRGLGANHASNHAPAGGSPAPEPPARDDAADLDRWAALHEAAEKLPAEEREVFGLTFYHDWTQQQIAELFGVDERTVRRRLRRAVEALGGALGGELPGD